MPSKKLLISLDELQQAFYQLPINGHPDNKITVPIELPQSKPVHLEFRWDYNQEQWQLYGENLIIAPTRIL